MTKQTILEHRGIRMDLLGHTVSYNNEPIDLTNREYALLEALLQNKGRVLTRTQIGEKIWEAQFEMQTNLIDVYIRKLRKNLGDNGDPPLIKTVRGVGYSIP
jgi:DNA-binding response OmpR family regulator